MHRLGRRGGEVAQQGQVLLRPWPFPRFQQVAHGAGDRAHQFQAFAFPGVTDAGGGVFSGGRQVPEQDFRIVGPPCDQDRRGLGTGIGKRGGCHVFLNLLIGQPGRSSTEESDMDYVVDYSITRN